MKEQMITTEISPKALHLLRLISALMGEKQYEVVDRLLIAEAKRLSCPMND